MIKRILIVNVNWVGDVLFSTPFIKAVREANPDAYIACLIHPRCAEVLASNPRIDEIIVYDEEGGHESLFGKLKLVAELRNKRFDTAFLLHRSFTKALLVYLAGIKERIGYPTKKRRGLLTKRVEEPDDKVHKVEYFLRIAASAGIVPRDTSYEFFVEARDREYVKTMLHAEGIAAADRVAVLCPGGNWDPKRWPKERFALLGDALAQEFCMKIVIAAAKKDAGLTADVKSLMKSPVVDTAGRTGLKQLGALLERAELVIANDTGPMHLAVAVGAKTIALFGPTDPAMTGPYGKGHYRVIFKNIGCDVPCYDMTCTDNTCMKAIPVEDVVAAAREMFKG